MNSNSLEIDVKYQNHRSIIKTIIRAIYFVICSMQYHLYRGNFTSSSYISGSALVYLCLIFQNMFYIFTLIKCIKIKTLLFCSQILQDTILHTANPKVRGKKGNTHTSMSVSVISFILHSLLC